METYVKRAIIVEAIQYTEETRDQIIEWSGAHGTGIDDNGAEYELANLRIGSVLFGQVLHINEWLVKEVGDRFIIYSPEHFAKTHVLNCK